MKILIIHDRFQFRGGAERLILILARALSADIMTEFWLDGETFSRQAAPHKLYVLDKGEAPWIVWRYFRAHFNFLFKTRRFVRRYDVVIFSGNNCLSASFNCHRRTKKILYCHSPVRHVYDLWRFARDEQTSQWKKIIYYNLGAWLIRFIYRLGIKRMQTIIANSMTTKDRLKNFVGVKADSVIYPPIEITKFKWLSQGDYYLSFGRLERLKRIPDIITAFQKMPVKRLVVVSGGPDLAKVKSMAAGHNNIKVVGWVNDDQLAEYVGRCIATIYIPLNEDFGMTTLESMAAGKPCLGVFEGGLKETIINGVNGKFIPADYQIADIISAVNWLTPERALSMRVACETRAAEFSLDKFTRQIKSQISKLKTLA